MSINELKTNIIVNKSNVLEYNINLIDEKMSLLKNAYNGI